MIPIFAVIVAAATAAICALLFSYTDFMFNYIATAAATSLTQMFNGVGTTAGNYNALYDGTLVAIDIVCTPQAATSLAQSGRVEITSSSFMPNKLVIGFAGFGGLQTVPAFAGGGNAREPFAINQPVRTAVPITATHLFYASPVTPNLIIQGYFTSP